MATGVLTYLVASVPRCRVRRVLNFWLSGTLLGVGWCFLYVGGTTLLTEAYRPEEKAKAQGINDMLVFVVMGTSSALSGRDPVSAGLERAEPVRAAVAHRDRRRGHLAGAGAARGLPAVPRAPATLE